MSREKVIEIARGELGYTESPVNRTKYWEDYDPKMQAQPWCVCFLWWVFNTAGERMAFFGGGKTARCSVLLEWYQKQGLTVPVEQVQVGDIVILNFHGTKDTEHCGLVTCVDRVAVTRKLLQVQTIEGNTSENASQSNGDRVCEKTRYPSQIVGVCRPQYKPEEPEKIDDITGHWAYKDIQWAREKGLLKGYADGSMRPDQPVTRAELATVLRRLMKE